MKENWWRYLQASMYPHVLCLPIFAINLVCNFQRKNHHFSPYGNNICRRETVKKIYVGSFITLSTAGFQEWMFLLTKIQIHFTFLLLKTTSFVRIECQNSIDLYLSTALCNLCHWKIAVYHHQFRNKWRIMLLLLHKVRRCVLSSGRHYAPSVKNIIHARFT